MAKKYMVRRKDGSYLSSPWGQVGDGSGLENVRWWTKREEDAHHFDSRGEAKAKLREANEPTANINFIPIKLAA